MKNVNPSIDELRDWGPQICFYWAGVVNTSQFNIWKPYIMRSSRKIIIWSDSKSTTPKSLVNLNLKNVVFLDQKYSRQHVKELASLKIFLYVTHKKDNFKNIYRFKNARHIHINHGESLKGSNSKPEFVLYDFLIWANKDAVDRFSLMIRPFIRMKSKFMGVPFLEPIIESAPRENTPSHSKFLLYQPTWEGYRDSNNYTSIDIVHNEIAELVADSSSPFKLLLRPHPATGSRDLDLKVCIEKLRTLVFRSGFSKYEDYQLSDLAITDISGATAEYLASKKPIIVPFTERHESKGLRPADIARKMKFAYVWEVGSESLESAIRNVLSDESLAIAREQQFDRYYGGFTTLDESSYHFNELLVRIETRSVFRLPIWVHVHALKLLRNWYARKMQQFN